MANYQTNDSESGKASIIIILVILLIFGGLIASNYVGPGKGWVDKILTDKSDKEKIVESVPSVPTPEPAKITPTIPEAPPKVEPKKKEEESAENNVKKLYDSLFAKYRKKFPDPKIGKTYDVYLKSGKTRGKLKDFSDGKIVIQKTGVTVTYRLDIVSKKSYPKLFPKKAAKILALKELKKVLEEQVAGEEAKQNEQEYTVVDAKATASNSIPRSSSSSKTFSYNPEAQATPKRLKKPLASFAEWVQVQQRRVGGRLGEKIYAKQQGRNVVLYMETSKLFRQQSYDVRFTVAEGMWQIWGFKCIDHGVTRTPNQAHIVLVDKKGRIIGGSSKDDASNVWVKK